MSHHQEGNDFYGIYGAFRDRIPDSVVEPYIRWRLSPGFKSEEGKISKLDEKTVGLRWAGTASRFDYDAETATQFGNIGTDPIRAWMERHRRVRV